ncbi:MAG: OmpA family protein [Bdellovibrionales bacterium]|nr:OmpA family protein [Bdellovibrionales bacterium]
MDNRNFIIGLTLLAALTAGCSSEPKVSELSAQSDPQVEIDRLDTGMKRAIGNQVDILSPDNFAQAKRARDDAMASRADNKKQGKVLHQISLAWAYLERANGVAAVANQILPGPIDARRDAIAAQADILFRKETDSIDNDLRQFTKRIEKNDTSVSDDKKVSLEANYRDIEMKALKQTYLGEAQQTLKMATDEGAEKLTPETLSWATTRILSAESSVEKNRHSIAVLTQASTEAKESANRLLKMVRDAKGSKSMRPEDFAKKVESNEKAEAQSDKNLTQASTDLALSQGRLANATARNVRLESEVALDREFESARRQFGKDEAEVYKQGDNLLLRLKGLSFASNQAVIGSSNFPLLAKVQRVIREIGATKVVVEGHTDSVGGKELNAELSTRRAEAIQAYMVSNKNVAPDRISAIGHGDSKPISSNKTAAGRAQNRRVDLIISADANAKKE